MALFSSQRPQPRPAFLLWSYRRVQPGSTTRAWTAGPLVGVTVHWSGCSKPCRKGITGGKLKCLLCEAEMRPRWIGYQPLYDQHFKRMVITVSETVGPSVSDLAFGTFIEIARPLGQRDPLRVRQVEAYQASRFPETLAKMGVQDITPWLVHLWGDSELASYFKLNQQASSEQNGSSQTLPGASQSDPALIETPPPRSTTHAPAAQKPRPGPNGQSPTEAPSGGAAAGDDAAGAWTRARVKRPKAK